MSPSVHSDSRERRRVVAALNVGSSNVKLAVFDIGPPRARLLRQRFERDPALPLSLDENARTAIVEALDTALAGAEVVGVGHRIVQGGERFREPTRVTPDLLAELRRLSIHAPEHLPAEIALIESLASRRADLLQVACFDTAFHADLPRVARLLPLPRRYQDLGLVRLGFHGLSCAYLMEELGHVAPAEAAGRVILAHLGNGASMTAVLGGRSIETTMGFSTASGLVMGTRSGDLDPGIVRFLAVTAGIDLERFHDLVHAHSGLLGLSETSSDMRKLLERERDDVRAAEAVAVFCHQARKAVGALAATLGGLDTLVFSGGIGEHAPLVRERICEGLQFLGIELDAARNVANDPVISSARTRVTIRRIETDEESQIASGVCRVVGVPFATTEIR